MTKQGFFLSKSDLYHHEDTKQGFLKFDLHNYAWIYKVRFLSLIKVRPLVTPAVANTLSVS